MTELSLFAWIFISETDLLLKTRLVRSRHGDHKQALSDSAGSATSNEESGSIIKSMGIFYLGLKHSLVRRKLPLELSCEV